jgi:transcriptional regulator with GAF, ATPase, and Fis domain
MRSGSSPRTCRLRSSGCSIRGGSTSGEHSLARSSGADAEDDAERARLVAVLEAHDYNVSAAARELNMQRSRVRRLMDKFEIGRKAG